MTYATDSNIFVTLDMFGEAYDTLLEACRGKRDLQSGM